MDNLPKVIADREILHRADTQGPRITREQDIQLPDGTVHTVAFWSDSNGKLLRVE